ncbi:hypothetical protein Acr_23g0018000 [Actinidia rufa]|uniref:Uncharacterized protein n=1 Tax=Actinidia rufa TaxID=165716 RepID=A0A7J0GRH5_9ERIC|nr:hypothetical protein Acr_23g0018000 [Actinidia rufa]
MEELLLVYRLLGSLNQGRLKSSSAKTHFLLLRLHRPSILVPRKNPLKGHSKSNLFHAVLPKLNLRRTSPPPSPASSLSSSSFLVTVLFCAIFSIYSSKYTRTGPPFERKINLLIRGYTRKMNMDHLFQHCALGTARGANGRSHGWLLFKCNQGTAQRIYLN